MGKKYIIEIPDDKIGDFVGSTHFLMPYMMAGHIGHHDTGLPIEPYTEPDLEQVRKEAYDKGYDDAAEEKYNDGLADAWDAARTLWNTPNRKEIFGNTTFNTVLTTLTAQETIEKIQQYEQEKEEQIQVGDEVINQNKTAVVTEITNRYTRIMYSDGSGYALFAKGIVKTGRHFPEIAEVLQKMKES